MLEATAKFQKLGNSQELRFSDEILKAANSSYNETVELFVDEKRIRIQNVKCIQTLDELFENYDSTYKCQEISTGNPVGNEVW